MDFVSFSARLTSLAAALSGIGLTVGGLVAAGIVALLLYRTSSAHPLLLVLWGRVFGKLTVGDARIQAYVDELNSLSRFTFLTGLRLQTMHDAHRLLDWCQQWNVGTASVRACRAYFDLQAPGLRNGKAPKNWSVAMLFFLTFGVTAAGLTSAAFAVPDSAFVTIKKSGDSLWLSESSAIRFPARGRERLHAKDCDQPGTELTQRTGFVKEDAELLCSFFSGKDEPPAEYVERTAAKNRMAFCLLGALALMLALMLAGECRESFAANRLLKHLHAHAQKGKDLGPVQRRQ